MAKRSIQLAECSTALPSPPATGDSDPTCPNQTTIKRLIGREGAQKAMTLLLTECSKAGVVMAADSAITRKRRGKIVSVDESGWSKVLKVPQIHAAVGYWGDIGIIHSARPFDEWIQNLIEQAAYSDLPSLATTLADTLNKACNNKPLADNQYAGLHVAGFHAWDDGKRRPFFFHVHNGHGQWEAKLKIEIEPGTGKHRVVKVEPRYVAGSPTLFEPHQDFPDMQYSIDQNLKMLETVRPLTRNGAFLNYSIIWDRLDEALKYLNLIPNFAIPRDESLGARRGLLIAALEITIRLYKLSNQPRIIGGKVKAVAIHEGGYMLN